MESRNSFDFNHLVRSEHESNWIDGRPPHLLSDVRFMKHGNESEVSNQLLFIFWNFSSILRVFYHRVLNSDSKIDNFLFKFIHLLSSRLVRFLRFSNIKLNHRSKPFSPERLIISKISFLVRNNIFALVPEIKKIKYVNWEKPLARFYSYTDITNKVAESIKMYKGFSIPVTRTK